MRQILISLPDALMEELEAASANTRELGFGPERFAQEIIECEMAARRLPKVALGTCARVSADSYPVHIPEMEPPL